MKVALQIDKVDAGASRWQQRRTKAGSTRSRWQTLKYHLEPVFQRLRIETGGRLFLGGAAGALPDQSSLPEKPVQENYQEADAKRQGEFHAKINMYLSNSGFKANHDLGCTGER